MNPLKQRFIELFKATKWSQAHAARRMEMTRGFLNGIVTGPHTPSAAAVKLLEMIVMEEKIPITGNEATAREHVQEIERREIHADALTKKLCEIHERDPKAFKAAKAMIETMHTQISYTVPASSKKTRRRAGKIHDEIAARIQSARKPAP